MITLRNWVSLGKTYAHPTRKPDTTPPLSLREWDRRRTARRAAARAASIEVFALPQQIFAKRQRTVRVALEPGETVSLAQWRDRERTAVRTALTAARVDMGLPVA